MKRAIIINLIFLTNTAFVLESYGQVKRLYAFSQPITGGAFLDPAIQKKLAEQGINSQRARQFVYAEIKKGVPFQIAQLWIHRKGYSCPSTSPVSCPVIIPSTDHSAFPDDTLIRSTIGEIIKLDFQESKSSVLHNNVRKLIANNEVVMEYKIRSKTYYVSTKYFRQLHPFNTQ